MGPGSAPREAAGAPAPDAARAGVAGGLSLPAARGDRARRDRRRPDRARDPDEPLPQRPDQAAGVRLHRARQLRVAARRRRIRALALEIFLLVLRLPLAPVPRRLRGGTAPPPVVP